MGSEQSYVRPIPDAPVEEVLAARSLEDMSQYGSEVMRMCAESGNWYPAIHDLAKAGEGTWTSCDWGTMAFIAEHGDVTLKEIALRRMKGYCQAEGIELQFSLNEE